MEMALAIEGGTVVTSRGRRRAHVYVDGGRIVALSQEPLPARERVDASGLLVMPGMVDTHVHLMDPASTDREDFPTGTAAAVRAGVTTIVEHTHASPVRNVADLADKRAYIAGRSRVDFGLAAHAWPDRIDEVPALWRAGVAFFKVFTCTTHGVPGFDPGPLRALLERVAGAGAVVLVHAEEASLLDVAEAELRAAGRSDGALIGEWRNREAELAGLSVASMLARRAGARVVMAHVSNAEALEYVRREQQPGASIAVETCPQYLTLKEADAMDELGFRKFTPPARARSQADLDAMWAALSDNRVHHMATDHAPSARAHKADGSVWDIHFGLPGLDTTLSVLLDGAHAGRISYEQVVGLYSEGPVRAYGLPRTKGSLRAGADADIVLVDPNERWTVVDEDVISKAGWSPLAGRTLVGRAVRTYLRGVLAADGGNVLAEPGLGRFLSGGGAEAQ